ncbi:MAG TPA: NAD(P)-dependent oxidoreductase [Bacteroidales bacterium]|nr:NAD(P)-dependent oxidoreductase [Bacteroidales bacterium]
MKIGFAGIGSMGRPMAANLLKAGFEVTIYNRTPQKTQSLADAGGRLVNDPAGLAGSEVVITMLSDDNALLNITQGENGLINGMQKGSVHVSMSTISTALSEKLTIEHQNAGQNFISAPVFGRPEAAAAAKLFIVAAGNKISFEILQPVFDALGQKTFYLGTNPRDANLFKLSGNFLIATVIESLGEVMALFNKAGMNRQQCLDIFTSTLFSSPIYVYYGKLVIEQQFTPPGFAAPLGLKDVKLAMAASEALHVPMPLVNLLHQRYVELMANGGEKMDWSAIAGLAMKNSGQ